MPTPFPGMDPYLERRGLWEEIHTDLISHIRQFLIPLLRPKYRVAIEQRTYLSLVMSNRELTGKPDILVTENRPIGPRSAHTSLALAEPTVAEQPIAGELPTPEEVVDRYLEIRDTKTHEVITAIEILSPTNKQSPEGRHQYEQKRLKVLASATNLVEIDLLRAGKPFAMKAINPTQEKQCDYRIVISRSWQRPRADLYFFRVRQPIPSFLIPLRAGEQEPVLPLNQILHDLYDLGGYDLAIDYDLPADPALSSEDAIWAAQLLRTASLPPPLFSPDAA
jgi:hypothetical protein